MSERATLNFSELQTCDGLTHLLFICAEDRKGSQASYHYTCRNEFLSSVRPTTTIRTGSTEGPLVLGSNSSRRTHDTRHASSAVEPGRIPLQSGGSLLRTTRRSCTRQLALDRRRAPRVRHTSTAADGFRLHDRLSSTAGSATCRRRTESFQLGPTQFSVHTSSSSRGSDATPLERSLP
jgi:hypothetical protein